MSPSDVVVLTLALITLVTHPEDCRHETRAKSWWKVNRRLKIHRRSGPSRQHASKHRLAIPEIEQPHPLDVRCERKKLIYWITSQTNYHWQPSKENPHTLKIFNVVLKKISGRYLSHIPISILSFRVYRSGRRQIGLGVWSTDMVLF